MSDNWEKLNSNTGADVLEKCLYEALDELDLERLKLVFMYHRQITEFDFYGYLIERWINRDDVDFTKLIEILVYIRSVVQIQCSINGIIERSKTSPEVKRAMKIINYFVPETSKILNPDEVRPIGKIDDFIPHFNTLKKVGPNVYMGEGTLPESFFNLSPTISPDEY